VQVKLAGTLIHQADLYIETRRGLRKTRLFPSCIKHGFVFTLKHLFCPCRTADCATAEHVVPANRIDYHFLPSQLPLSPYSTLLHPSPAKLLPSTHSETQVSHLSCPHALHALYRKLFTISHYIPPRLALTLYQLSYSPSSPD
jgi:hypothetical protein